jgi:hypothetical protein
MSELLNKYGNPCGQKWYKVFKKIEEKCQRVVEESLEDNELSLEEMRMISVWLTQASVIWFTYRILRRQTEEHKKERKGGDA